MQRRYCGGGLMALVWSPTPEAVADEALVARVAALTYAGRTPLHESLVAMLGGLSKHILSDAAARRVPQYVSLAYWLRPAALTRLCEDLARSDASGFLRVPRGVALHLPPTNVDTIFVYSWAMSVLAGNANVVRLAETLSADAQWLVGAVSRVVSEHGEGERHLFCHYSYGGETERSLASNADLRMIWGGDAKVEAVSRVPVRPDGLSLGFPDRQSMAIVAADAYRQTDDTARDALAVDFFNDVFWFDQMGCGSPRVLVWVGEPGTLAEDFFGRLTRVINQRNYNVETGVAVGKFVLANNLLAEGVVRRYHRHANALDVTRTEDPGAAMARSHGGGFLCDWVTDSVDDVALVVTRKVQTLTHFGLSSENLDRLARKISGRGGYRIVPVGQALQFDPTWDGVDLFEHMTRRVIIR
jgi:hypothetical protein